MPDAVRTQAERAIDKHRQRYGAPAIEMSRDDEGRLEFCNPYREEDLDNWQALVFEAFGTCSASVVQTFLNQLAGHCLKEWSDDTRGWRPDAAQLTAAINIIGGMKVENEAQACMAAQMVAMHYSAMKLTNPDERTAATLVRIAKAFGCHALTLGQLQGKVKRVEQHFHYHDERHVHLKGGRNSGGQALATTEEIDLVPQANGGSDASRLALPCSRPDNREALRLASGKRQAGMPDAWWGQRVWRALWNR